MSKFDELLTENLRMKAIIVRGHDSHDCPNGTSPDGHCENCLDPYWQTAGPKFQAQLLTIGDEINNERERCCMDVCPACAVAQGAELPVYQKFWNSVEPAWRDKYGHWLHEMLYSNGAILQGECTARAIRERHYQSTLCPQSLR